MVLVGLGGQYRDVAETLMRLKVSANIVNNSSAFLLMTRVTELYCGYLEAAHIEGIIPPWDTILPALVAQGIIDAQDVPALAAEGLIEAPEATSSREKVERKRGNNGRPRQKASAD